MRSGCLFEKNPRANKTWSRGIPPCFYVLLPFAQSRLIYLFRISYLEAIETRIQGASLYLGDNQARRIELNSECRWGEKIPLHGA